MKLPIKVRNETYYLNSKEIEQVRQFRKNKEIEFIRNTIKLWNNIMTRQEYNREASTQATCNWVEVRNQAAIAAMQGLLANSWSGNCYDYATAAVILADALVEQLKGK